MNLFWTIFCKTCYEWFTVNMLQNDLRHTCYGWFTVYLLRIIYCIPVTEWFTSYPLRMIYCKRVTEWFLPWSPWWRCSTRWAGWSASTPQTPRSTSYTHSHFYPFKTTCQWPDVFSEGNAALLLLTSNKNYIDSGTALCLSFLQQKKNRSYLSS